MVLKQTKKNIKVSSTPQPRQSNVNLGSAFFVTVHTIINLTVLNSKHKNIFKHFYKIKNKHTVRKHVKERTPKKRFVNAFTQDY